MKAGQPVSAWYSASPYSGEWLGREAHVAHTRRLADALLSQAEEIGAGESARANIERLRAGARAVVTGQQVGLFGGPLLTLLKAATAIAQATKAEAVTGIAHVPIFWLATEDHDLAEVDLVALPGKKGISKLRLGEGPFPGIQMPAGEVLLPLHVDELLDQVSELLGHAPVCDLLRECYGHQPGSGHATTYGKAFARFMAQLFSEYGLIVMDPAGREFHALGAEVLRAAIERAGELEDALLQRTADLENQGYSAQVLVKRGSSLLFLISEVKGSPGALNRQALRRAPEGGWKAGGTAFSTAELLAILEASPERLSPNALLRPVFQDVILPTVAYVGGPAEIAYFAQSAVVYQAILGRVTAVLPRLTATIIGPVIGALMNKHQIELKDLFTAKTPEELTQRLGARAMPIEGKLRLAAVGTAMDAELTALCEYLEAMDVGLGRSAKVSGRKMRYQMNRLRRLASTFEVQKHASLRREAESIMLQLFPEGHLQERVIGGIWFLAQTEGVLGRIITEAKRVCLGHSIIRG